MTDRKRERDMTYTVADSSATRARARVIPVMGEAAAGPPAQPATQSEQWAMCRGPTGLSHLVQCAMRPVWQLTAASVAPTQWLSLLPPATAAVCWWCWPNGHHATCSQSPGRHFITLPITASLNAQHYCSLISAMLWQWQQIYITKYQILKTGPDHNE